MAHRISLPVQLKLRDVSSDYRVVSRLRENDSRRRENELHQEKPHVTGVIRSSVGAISAAPHPAFSLKALPACTTTTPLTLTWTWTLTQV